MDGGKRGLIFDNMRDGVQDKVRGEGIHFYIPIIQRPILFDIRIDHQKIKTITGTRGKER